MPYIWEKYSKDKTYSIGKKICPYMEVFCNNRDRVEINPLIRFPDIAAALSDINLSGYIEDKDALENVIFHYLAQLDKNKGLSYKQVIAEKLREEVGNGFWGEEISTLWKEIDPSDKEILLYVLVQKMLNDNQTFFMEAVGKMFLNSSLCYEEKNQQYYLYLGAAETEYNLIKIKMIKIMFWNLKSKLLIIWDKHYGIVGIDDTMRIDCIQIV